MENMLSAIKGKWAVTLIVIFLILLTFWLFINYGSLNTDSNRQIWAATYQIIAFIGGLLGLSFAKLWGGYKSLMGRAVMAISIGLLLQCFGQSAYSYYIFYEQIDVPYPSLGDIGYFGSVIFYIYGLSLIAKVSGVQVTLKSLGNKFAVFLVPLAMLIISYFLFLQEYTFDWSSPVQIFLDFGYPFGEALYVSIALMTLVFSRRLLGGTMKGPIQFLVFALIFQYISDFTFLYQSSREIWMVGSSNDLLYSISYLLMSIGLIYIARAFYKIRES